MSAPRASVVIPTYNRASVLARAIDSVLCQTFQDFELLIVDDGSTDQTREMVKPYLERPGDRIQYFYQPHSSVPVARNFGIKSSRGEYIAFLDSDDAWLETKLEKQIQFLDQSTAALVHTNRKVVDCSSGKRSRLLPVPKVYALNSAHLLSGKSFLANTVVVRSSVLRSVGGFDESLFTTQDLDLWIRIARQFEIAFLDEPLMISYKMDDGLSYSNLKQKYADRIRVIRKILRNEHPLIVKSAWYKHLLENSVALLFEKLNSRI